MRSAGIKFLSAVVVFLLIPINIVYPLAPPSQTDRLMAALQAALSKPNVIQKTSSLPEILNAALDNIFLPPSMQEDRAKKIFGDNPERMDDLIERLRNHGALKLHLEREKLGEIINLVERMRKPGEVGKKEMHRLTGFRNREMLLLALDHALDPDPYHPIHPRKYYHSRQDRLIPVPWVHGAVRVSQNEESANLLSGMLDAGDNQKVWVHVEYTSQALSQYLIPTMMPLWEEILLILMAEKDPRERMFTPNTLSKISKNAKLETFLNDMVREMQEAGVQKTFTRQEMEATVAKQELSGDIKLTIKKFPQILDILKHFLKNPKVEGVVLETEGQDATTILNSFLSEFLYKRRHARYLRKYFANSLDYLRWQRYIDEVFMVLRDDHMLDVVAKISEKNPEASVAVLRGSAHAWMGPWFKSHYPFAKLLNGTDVTDYVLISALDSLGRGVAVRDEQEDKRILVDDIISNFATVVATFVKFPDILRVLPDIRKRISGLSLSELILIHDSSSAQGFVASSAMVQALQERGLLLDFSDKTLWDLPGYRYVQFMEILSIALRDTGYQHFLINNRISGLILVPSIVFLEKGMTQSEKDKFMRLAMRARLLPAGPKDLVYEIFDHPIVELFWKIVKPVVRKLAVRYPFVLKVIVRYPYLHDRISNNPKEELSWTTVKTATERLAAGYPILGQMMPQIREWFIMMQQDLGKPVNLTAHPEDLGNMGLLPQDFAA